MLIGRALAMLVRLYQLTFGVILPNRCRYEPSCSRFAIEALRANGAIRGGAQTVWRLLRCAPWGGMGYDPVPLPRARRTEASRG